MEILNEVLGYITGGTTFLGIVAFIAYHKQTKRVKDAEAKQAEAEARQKEIDAEKTEVDVEKAKLDARQVEINRLIEQIDHQQSTIENLLEVNSALTDRFNKQNEEIDGHIQRRHELVDKLAASENETNRVNTLLNTANQRIIQLTEERDIERARADYNEMWRCEWTDCNDPRGRRPPRDLAGLTYTSKPKPCTQIVKLKGNDKRV